MAPHVDDVVAFAEQHLIDYTNAKRFLRHGARHCVHVQPNLWLHAVNFVYNQDIVSNPDMHRYFHIGSKFFFKDPEVATLIKLHFG